MADDMLSKVSGWQYQPYSADNALLDPAAELGDGVSINGLYSGIFSRSTHFSSLMEAEISAPTDEEIEHEHTSAVESASDRAYSRLVKAVNSRISQTANLIQLEVNARTAADHEINSQLSIQSGQISAKVSKSGGDSSSFGWSLDDSSWTLQSGNRNVLRADSTGLHIEGEITAKSGTIGGFTISDYFINYGGMTWESTASNGIYIGTSGIKLGSGFEVDTSGNLTANNLNANNAVFSGTLKVGDGYISANDLRGGAASAVANGGFWSGGAGYGYNFDSMKNGGSYSFPINASSFRYQGRQLTPQTISIVDYFGNVRTFSGVLMYV